MEGVPINEKFLAEAGGWQAMKEARQLVAAGRVSSASYHPPLLQGLVAEGGNQFRSGLSLRSSTDLENICACRASRQQGMICAHSLAIGLYYLQQQQTVTAPARILPEKTARPPGLRKSVTEGEPLKIHLIFPPNFSTSPPGAKTTLFFEGETNQSRQPLDRTSAETLYQVGPDDFELIDHLEALAGTRAPSMITLDSPAMAGLFPFLRGHPRLTLGKKLPLSVEGISRRGKLFLRSPQPGQLEVRLELDLPLGPDSRVFVGDSAWVFQSPHFWPLPLPRGLPSLFQGPIKLAGQQVPEFLMQILPQLAEQFAVEQDFEPAAFSVRTASPQFLCHLEGGLARLEARLEVRYDQQPFAIPAGDQQRTWLPWKTGGYWQRDTPAEESAVQQLGKAGFTGPDRHGKFLLSGERPVLDFFAKWMPSWEKAGWKLSLEPRLEKVTQTRLERIDPRFQVRPADLGFFDLTLQLSSTSGEKLSPADVQRLILSGQNHQRLASGKIGLVDTSMLEDWHEVLHDVVPQQEGGAYRVMQKQAPFLQQTFARNGWKLQANDEWKSRSLSGKPEAPMPSLGQLAGILREYQKRGVEWLWNLRLNGFSGILADEMGLGKTLQVLSFIQTCRQEKSASGPTLVVAPTSLVWNWLAEVQRFVPNLKTLVLSGADRHESFSQVASHDLVLTSYALLRRDLELYAPVEFDLLVLDEGQQIKNPQSQIAQAVKAIRARNRLVLTGTPMENSVLDLWSIFDFLMPGYLGPAREFKERYELPIAREKNAEAQSRLVRRVRPFILRRLKREVAPELPQRLEQTSFCELSSEQLQVYRQLLQAGRAELFQGGQEKEGPRRMRVLTALLRLRQACCDLRLLPLPNLKVEETSGKTAMFLELLEESIAGGHRVLVFSQFVSLLSLLREELEKQELKFCYLDGRTIDRAGEVRRFQENDDIPVFLLSLKAAGVGLNLTAADTVIHFDPWWNPAVEAQATDRAHRIGQSRVVTSYKLIARGTVEEKILLLQQRKRSVTEAILQNDQQLTESLNWNEIEELLAE